VRVYINTLFYFKVGTDRTVSHSFLHYGLLNFLCFYASRRHQCMTGVFTTFAFCILILSFHLDLIQLMEQTQSCFFHISFYTVCPQQRTDVRGKSFLSATSFGITTHTQNDIGFY